MQTWRGGVRQDMCVAVMLGVLMLPWLDQMGLAQGQPQSGGELVMAVAAEPPSYDGHREETFGLIHPVAPFYSLLLRVDPDDANKMVGDLAEGWHISEDGRTYTFKIRQGVKFHDGSPLTANDVKASYDKIIFPPAGVVSERQSQYAMVAAIDVVDDGV